jgi:predicted membrane protein
MMGMLLLLGAVFLPRITMYWFSMGIPSVWMWVSSGWYIAPRITLAFLITTVYWHTNPEICLLTWFTAYGVASLKVDWLRDQLGEDVESIIIRVAGMTVKGLAVIAVVGVLLGGMYLGLLLLAKLFVALAIGVGNTNAIFGSIVGVLVFGSCLYIFRHASRVWYGITEIIVAVVLTYYTISRTVPSPNETIAKLNFFATVLALSSSIYIVVRGLDNIGDQNLKKLYIKLKYLIGRITLFVKRKMKLPQSAAEQRHAPDAPSAPLS